MGLEVGVRRCRTGDRGEGGRSAIQRQLLKARVECSEHSAHEKEGLQML